MSCLTSQIYKGAQLTTRISDADSKYFARPAVGRLKVPAQQQREVPQIWYHSNPTSVITPLSNA